MVNDDENKKSVVIRQICVIRVLKTLNIKL